MQSNAKNFKIMGRRKENCPEKWTGMKSAYSSWWEKLTIQEKVKAKEKFSKQYYTNLNNKHTYPEMWDLSNVRLSQLSDKHICRMYVFSDRDEKFNPIN